MAMDYWKTILDKLKDKLHPHTFNKLAASTFQIEEINGVVSIAVPNTTFKKDLSINYAPFINEAIKESNLDGIVFNYIITNGGSTSPLSGLSNHINPLYTFDNFIVGSSNNTAHAACKAVAESSPSTYNPLYLYGGVGLGKTHLISAVGNTTRKKQKPLILFTNADKFMNTMVHFIKNQKLHELRNVFLQCDILLMDDVQFLIGKEKTQEELFYIFDELHAQKKQIVFTSDCPPRDLKIEERLKSRFQWGLTVDIQPPDLETKIAILHKKAHMRNFTMPDDIGLYIASHVKSNVRELEGALIKLYAIASIKSCPVTLEFAKTVLKDLFPDEDRIITPSEIINCVAKHFGLKKDILFSKTNEKIIVEPRQIAMFLCKQLTKYSIVEIGHLFNKNHATVIHSINKTVSKMKSDPLFKQQIDSITKKVR